MNSKDSNIENRQLPMETILSNPHRHALTFLILSNVAIAFSYSLITAIYPIANEDQGLAQYYSGIVLALYPVSYALATLVSHRISRKMGLKALIVTSFTVVEITFVGLGLVFLLTRYIFYPLSIVAVVVQGAAVGCIDVSVRTYAQSLYGSQMETKSGYLRAAILIGFLLGPTIGSIFYHLTGYLIVMCVWAVVLFGFNALFIKYVSNSIAMTLILTSLGPRLWSLDKKEDNIAIGVFLVAVTLTPAIAALIYKRLPHGFDKRLLIIVSGLVIGVGALIMARLEIYSFLIDGSNSAAVTCTYVGGGLVGMGFTMVLLASLEELQIMLEYTNPRYGEEEILTLTARFFKGLNAIGFIAGPLLGGFLVDKYSFQRVVEWMGIGVIAVSVVFLVLCGYIQDKIFKDKYQLEKYEDIKDGPEDPQAASLLQIPETEDIKRIDLTSEKLDLTTEKLDLTVA